MPCRGDRRNEGGEIAVVTSQVPSAVHAHGRFVLDRRDFVPAYLRTYEEGRLREKVEEALSHLGPSCRVCPRLCKGVDRLQNQFGVCRIGRHARLSSAFPHFGEEDVLRGWRGSGTLFFSWCNLKCVFCLPPDGRVLTDRGFQRIEDLFLSGQGELERDGGKIRFPQGLRVYTREGKLAPVAKAFAHPYRGELLQIKPFGLPLLTVTPNHAVFATLRSDLKVQKVPSELLTRDHLLIVPKLRPGETPIELNSREAWEGELPRRPCYLETPDAFLVPIRRITRVPYEGPVYNLEVDDPDHSYIAWGTAIGNCQNFEVSQVGEGEEVDAREMARVMIRLQEMGCHNINFVTPEHVAPQIVEALPHAIDMGLRLPLVYNTSAYDSLDTLRVMDGLVDIYMPDFKLWDEEKARAYLAASNYPEVARSVIAEMHRQVGELKVDDQGLALRGLLVRHLVMPGRLDDTRHIVRWLAELSPDTYVNLMDQYYPAWKARTNPRFVEINRRVTRAEMTEAYRLARIAGLWRFDERWRVL
jgi:uncharacterized Fe-S radical SAM superfamily protein PflX